MESTIIGAQFRNSTDSALYLAKKRHDQDRYNQLVLKNTLTIANGKHSSLATVPQTGDLAGGGSCDAGYHPESCDPLTDDFWVGCAADLTCFGMMDDINSFVGQLANYLAVGAALGGTIFGTLSVLSADAAAVVLVEIGLGTALGGGIVIAFAGGYIVGTGIYYVGTWVYVNGGSLMYSGRKSSLDMTTEPEFTRRQTRIWQVASLVFVLGIFYFLNTQVDVREPVVIVVYIICCIVGIWALRRFVAANYGDSNRARKTNR